MKLKLIGLMVLGALTACSDAPPQELAADPAAELAAASPAEVLITAKDYGFELPDTLAAGVVTLKLVNQGKELHHVGLIRLDDGHTFGDFMTALQSHGPMPAWAVELGGPNAIGPSAPGDAAAPSTNATVDLKAGTYVVICFIPSPDGMPHVMKGMVRELTVVDGASPSTAAIPAADIVLTLKDYTFEPSTPITAGRHIIRLQNEAAQPHEVVFAKLNPGKTAADLVAWSEKMEGPPPGEIVGGISGLGAGLSSQTEVEFTPGEYALLCFVPDAKDGKPHIAHGMVKQITVN